MSGDSTAAPIRVCLVGPSLDILGGQAVQLDRLRTKLSQLPELDVSVIAVNPRLPGPFRMLQKIKYVRTVVTSIAYVATLIVRIPRVDVVHAFSASYWSFLIAPLPALIVGRLFGKRVLLNYRSGEAPDHLANWPISRRLMRLAHVVIAPSGYLVHVFSEYGFTAQSVVNFVNVDAIPYRDRKHLRPIFFSNRNLEALYNVECTIRAFARVQLQVPEAQLVVAGDGSERARLEALVTELGVRHVTFVGRVPPATMGALYDAADIYLNSPNIDNMPNSVIEAFAAGIPVVTTDAGGIPWIVDHEQTALMVPVGDERGMATQALRLLRSPELATRLTHNARTVCLTKYVWDAVRAEWLSVYQQRTGQQVHNPRVA